MTKAGGASNNGTVFSLTPPSRGSHWTETILYSFTGGGGGTDAVGGVRMNASGMLYGTTTYGGAANFGTVYTLVPGATAGTWVFTTIYSFLGSADGASPAGWLAQDSQGDIYGVTQTGGINNNEGTLFELVPPSGGQTAWSKTTIHSFNAATGDGYGPIGLSRAAATSSME